jgi:hypothetical protein
LSQDKGKHGDPPKSAFHDDRFAFNQLFAKRNASCPDSATTEQQSVDRAFCEWFAIGMRGRVIQHVRSCDEA